MMRTGFILLLAIGVFAGLGYARNDHDGRSERKQFRNNMMEKLKLTDAQKEHISKLRFDHQKSLIDARARTQKARLELRHLMQSEKPERASIDKSLKSVSDAQFQQKMLWVDHWFAVRALLTPEQQELWKDLPHNLLDESGRSRHRDRQRDDDRESD